MGSGKTTWMLNHIKAQHLKDLSASLSSGITIQKRYIYITPTLSEVDRVVAECSELDFRNPEPIEGRKYFHLEKLISEGRNICTTHSLFLNLTRQTYSQLTKAGYTLVIDEVLNCVELYNGLTKKDQEHLFTAGMIKVDPDTKKLRWNELEFGDYRGRFEDIQGLCRNGNLVRFRESLLVWEFPLDFFRCFDQVFILTYLFHGSPMVSYLAADSVRYNMMAVQHGELVDWDKVDESALKANLSDIISIYEGNMNKVGEPIGKEHPFSSTWFDRVTDKMKGSIRSSLENFFKRVAQSPSHANAWTTFIKARAYLAGRGYSKGFLPNNLRATNAYIEKTSMAYLCNTFYHPFIKGYFTDRNIPVYEDLFALSEMIQWLWRGQIRRGDPIHVYIPSQRMRKLLKMWLESNNINDLFNKAGYGIPPVALPVM